jgi:hypothetical protein
MLPTHLEKHAFEALLQARACGRPPSKPQHRAPANKGVGVAANPEQISPRGA